jgi:DNA-binding CsgD family transcriptional regulator
MGRQEILWEKGNDVCVSKNTNDGSGPAIQVTDTFLENALVFNTDSDVELTKREKEILCLIVGGNTNKEIAKRLSRSERTVEFHRNRLMRKMAAHNSAQLVRRAIVLGVI